MGSQSFFSSVSGASTLTVTSKTANYTITNNDDVINANPNGGGFTLTLPAASGNPGKLYRVKNTNPVANSFNAVTIARAGSDTIWNLAASATSVVSNTQGEEIELVSDGVSVWYVLGKRTPKYPSIQTFLSSSGTYTTPTANVLYLRVRMVGGGGGGGGGSDNGNAATAGGAGTATTFGTALLSAGGGGAGGKGNGVGGTGGTSSLGSGPVGLALSGGGGTMGGIVGVASIFLGGGSGGNSAFGGGGSGASGNAASAGVAGSANTGGGGGAGSGPSGGYNGCGGGGGGYVEAYIYAPAATYTYVVGAGGTSGGSASGGSNGAAGGSGMIIVEEFYC